MHIELKRKDDAFHLEAINEQGQSVSIDGSPTIGGNNKGARPMELLIMGLGGCSSIDIIGILKKQKQILTEYSVSIQANRESDKVPALFTDIHIIFKLNGELNPTRVEQAIKLSMDKYCSVSRILEKTARITYGYCLNGLSEKRL